MKTLYLDIETAPAKAYIWDLKTRYVPVSQVCEDGYILCFAARWADSDTIDFWSEWDHGEDTMVLAAWNYMDEADAIIHFNGNKFDIPRLNSEFLVHRLGPPSPSHQIDLYQTVSRKFKVLSRSMNHMLKLLSLDSKLEHKGMALWTDVMNGDKEAQRIMEDYNCRDVEVMEDLYMQLRPWMDNHPNMGLWMDPGEHQICPNCGSTELRFKGYKRTRVLTYRQYHCEKCGYYPRERTSIEVQNGAKRRDILT